MDVREQLRLFTAVADQLQRCRMLQRHHRVGYTLNYDRLRGLWINVEQPDEEELRSMLVTLRQFISKGEPVYLHRIHNLCYQHLTDSGLRDRLAKARADWAQVSRRLPEFRFHVGEREVSPEHVADLVITEYFHSSDEAKMRELRDLRGGEPAATITRVQFLRYVLATVAQVLYVASVIRAALRENRLSA